MATWQQAKGTYGFNVRETVFGADTDLPDELLALMDEIQESRPYRCPFTLDMFA